MPEPTLADLFAEARTPLEGKIIPVLEFEPSVHEAGTFPDPAYDALRKVVDDVAFDGDAERYWAQAPDKALEGALIGALYPLRDIGADGLRDRLLSMVESRLMGEQGDTRIPAMQAFVEWLKEQHE